MYKVLILWAPDTADNQAVVGSVVRALESDSSHATARKAVEATIADINGSDVVVFGAGKTGAEDVPADFSEFLRTFKGVTLAGKTAGFFSFGSEKATARLRKSLKDTEVSEIDEDPLFNGQIQETPAIITQWARRLMGFHQEVRNGRT